MDNRSIWENKNKARKNSNKIDNFETDILIIGGGIAGISTAYFLINSNKSITLIDKSNIGMGVTSKTTAKLNYLQGTIYQILASNFDKSISKLYLDSQIEAIKLIKDIIKKEKIKCDLKECDSYIFTKNKNNIAKLDKEKKLLEKWNIECKEVNKLPISFNILKGFMVKDNYTFHPLKYIDSLKNILDKKINIYENVIASEITKKDNYYEVNTNSCLIKAKQVIVCCHYPFFIIPSFIPIKTYVKREYVNAAKLDESFNFIAISIDNILHSIRFYNDYIIYGSNQHRLTNKINYKYNYEQSKSDFRRLFSKDPEYTWMNQDIMSNDDLPLIGEVKNHKGLMIATGFGAWGMTNGTIAGKVISDIILGNKNKYIKLFDPNRINKSNIINSVIGAFHYSKVYIQTTVKRNHVFNNDYVYVVKIDGKNYGVYFDFYGKKHIVSIKCPHMKCNLVFNDEEKTWDCPCHGSRFDIDGNVIEGPANYSIGVNFFEKK